MRNTLSFGKIIVFFFILLFSFFVFLSTAQAQSSLSGLWKSSTGKTVEIGETEDGIKGTVKKSDDPADIGDDVIDGSIVDGLFKGQLYLKALTRKCSRLDGWYPATGKVSADGNTITASWKESKYSVETCEPTGNIDQGTITYTRVSPQISTEEQPSQSSPTPSGQDSYPTCASDCADQVEAKYQCPFRFPLDSCVSEKLSFQSVCQDACWDQWGLPPEPKLVERGAQIKKIEQDGKTALLVVGYDSSKPSDSAMEQMKDDLAGWDPDAVQPNIPTNVSNIPLGIGVLSLDGNDVDIKRPGSNTWETLRKGTAIPEGSQIFTGIDSNVWIYGKFGVANVAHGSYVTIERDSASQGNDSNIRFDIKFGEVEIRYEKANYQGIIQTRTPSAIAQVKGTKFFTSYNQEQRYTAVGVYEGQVEVQSLITGDKVELSSDSNSKSSLAFFPLQRFKEEVKQEPVVAKQEAQKQKSNNGIIISAILLLGMGGLIFFLYRTDRLMPLYVASVQKISKLIKKFGKNNTVRKS